MGIQKKPLNEIPVILYETCIFFLGGGGGGANAHINIYLVLFEL